MRVFFLACPRLCSRYFPLKLLVGVVDTHVCEMIGAKSFSQLWTSLCLALFGCWGNNFTRKSFASWKATAVCCLLPYIPHRMQTNWALGDNLVDVQNERLLRGDSNNNCDSQAALIHDPTPGRVGTSKAFQWCGTKEVRAWLEASVAADMQPYGKTWLGISIIFPYWISQRDEALGA